MLCDTARSSEAFTTPRCLPSSKPLFTASIHVCWFIFPSTMKGDLPLRVFTFTTPFDRSPYSTEGMPVTTSTDSMFDVLSVRVEAPAVSPISPLLFRRMPSTSMAVPNEALPLSAVPLRRAMRLSFISVGLMVFPPGISVVMSPTFISCWLSSVVRSMVYDVVASSSFRLSCFRVRRIRGMSLVMFITSSRLAYPRLWIISTVLPTGTFLMANSPLLFVIAQNPLAFISIDAYSMGAPLSSSVTLPAIVIVCANRLRFRHSMRNVSIGSRFFIYLLMNDAANLRIKIGKDNTYK